MVFLGMASQPTAAMLCSASYWLNSMETLTKHWTSEQHARFRVLEQDGARIAYWRSDRNGLPCNGGLRDGIVPVATGMIQKATGEPKQGTSRALCTDQVLHATLKIPRWNGSRLWVVALTGEIIGDDEKFGAPVREILGEAMQYSGDLGRI